jgi:predicted enzyme related to lactoylglutathione lyase
MIVLITCHFFFWRNGLQKKGGKGFIEHSQGEPAVKAAHVKGLVNRVNAKRAAVEEAEKAGGNAKKKETPGGGWLFWLW